MTIQPRSFNILVAALGGEGGGVLSDWLIAAATLEGFPVQSTSIPGVAQRTGATTYYLEIFPHKINASSIAPILALSPTPTAIDLVAASELIEAGRAIQNGFVSPQRTTLIASTSRVYAIGERAAMADGRFDGEHVVKAADGLARRAILFDMAATAQATGVPVNSVLFGAMIGSAVLPVSRASAEKAIQDSGKAVDMNLRGFSAGFEAATRSPQCVAPEQASAANPPRTGNDVVARAREKFPVSVHDVLERGLHRLLDYQGVRYAQVYLDRLEPIARLDAAKASIDSALTREVARFLALWMSYEDVIRVADLKTRGSRFNRIRKEVNAKDNEIVKVVDFLKPGLDELCSILPPGLGAAVLRFAEKRGLQDRLNVGLHIHSTHIFGFFMLRVLAGLRWWRPYSWRYQLEQALIENWLGAVAAAAGHDLKLALEIAECAQLVKGYGDTHKRGTHNFLLIAAAFFEREFSQGEVAVLTTAVRAARTAALADPEGLALEKSIQQSRSLIEKTAVIADGNYTRH